ncbi:DUF3472 domain-containing protein [Zhouia amylolytica]|uniref:F5/8 type C domain-containing protein n=1 Tax=Zhouia amylolytica AD3 TaxID=1286632 RepID=W2ULP0_9FLAO|nr:DUF3472 domain-containing protein [Zhouia amylolytica]ETN94889.1 protein of unknown function (DUF3472) [Zhouia amylolytica AD3]
MKTVKNTILTRFLLLGVLLFASCSGDEATTEPDEIVSEDAKLKYSYKIPPGGNSWVVNDISQNGSLISDTGIHNWTDLNTVIRTFFRVESAGELKVGLKMKVAEGTSKIKVTVGGESQTITVNSSPNYKDVAVGTFNLSDAGYQYVEIQGVEKSATYIADVEEVLIDGAATASGVTYVQDEFYWGRRGPSVHLSYTPPQNTDIKWFYNEVTVPEGEDVVGSYFMANGFGQGYFGMQVNSDTERRILFSVWSPYETQDPSQIPDDYKIILLGKGEGVTTGEFGNEGSGGQSYKVFDWQAGNTYKFLLKGEPSVNNSTDYTAYFYAPEEGAWKLIASFRRPYTSTYLTNQHSFLENFRTEAGVLSRKGFYGNQWVYDTQDVWHELTEAKFTADATARKGARLDYAGGSDGNKFFMKNCGFFSDNTTIDSYHQRTANGVSPNIDFSQLEVPSLPEEPTLLDRSGWVVTDFSTQEDNGGEGDTGRAADILDDDLNTFWHSCWSGCTATPPHHITVDMGESKQIDGFRFYQRQNLSRTVKDLEIQISDDGSTWESLGEFVLQNTAAAIDVDLSETKTFRYFKFIAKTAHDGTDNAAMAEIIPFTR